MKYFTFYRELNDFDDILNDTDIKKNAKLKIKWDQYLMIGISESKNESVCSMITLKYGDSMVNNLTKDFTPVPNVDYIPKKDKSKYSQSQV
jgi:hypothetical protein